MSNPTFVRPAKTDDVKNLKPLSTDAKFDEGSIVARPLELPNELDMKPVDPAKSLRWVQRVAGGGMRYEQCLAMGFSNAKIEDIQNKFLKDGASIKDGSIIRGDLILMIIDRARYEGALLWNHQSAVRRVQRTALKNDAVRAGRTELNGLPNEVLKKINFYQPSAEDAEQIVGPDKFEQP